MIKEGYKVAFRKDSEFIGQLGNPDGGAVGVVVNAHEGGWFKVKWLHGTWGCGKPITEPFYNAYGEKDLKVIP